MLFPINEGNIARYLLMHIIGKSRIEPTHDQSIKISVFRFFIVAFQISQAEDHIAVHPGSIE